MRGDTDRVLDLALRTLPPNAAEQGDGATRRAVDHYGESLRQYAALRLGVDAARAVVDGLSAGDERPAAGGRAGLFRAVRETWTGPDASPLQKPDTLPFYWPVDRSAGYLEALRDLRRRRVDRPAMEALELHAARGLHLDEVARVMGVAPSEADALVQDGRAEAVARFGQKPDSLSGDLDGAILEAFSLEPVDAPLPTPILAEGTVIGDRYHIEGRLGAGAFADVYRARDLQVPDHVVALKLFRRPAPDQRSADTALRELRHIAAVFHPSIVQFKDYGWRERRLWFVMPLLRGETLEDRIRRKPLDRREARVVFEPLADALAAMHELGVRHQDIKPSNVFLARLDRARDDGAADAPAPELGTPSRIDDHNVLPVLLDLGVAARDAELIVAGTPTYFAPEVAARFLGWPDPPSASPKSDVFSLALTLRDALQPAARERILGGGVAAFVRYRALVPPKPPRGPGLRFLAPSFARWLSLSPDERPAAGVFARELAVLTRPEERRAARARVVRWAVPLTMMLGAVFGSLVQMQRLEAQRAHASAEEQRLEAQRAQQRAAEISADLDVVRAHRRALEQDIVRIEREYESSRLTRRELAAKLAQTEGNLALLDERLSAEQRQLRRTREELSALEEALAAAAERERGLQQTLEETRRDAAADAERAANELASSRANEAELRARLDGLEDRIQAAERALSAARSAAVPRPTKRTAPDRVESQ